MYCTYSCDELVVLK